ncbi:MAG: hypothetical protein Q4B52_01600 [Tissierellia bacterium]|nr:hypothetical protein [Tissierellia bacterium]
MRKIIFLLSLLTSICLYDCAKANDSEIVKSFDTYYKEEYLEDTTNFIDKLSSNKDFVSIKINKMKHAYDKKSEQAVSGEPEIEISLSDFADQEKLKKKDRKIKIVVAEKYKDKEVERAELRQKIIYNKIKLDVDFHFFNKNIKKEVNINQRIGYHYDIVYYYK